MSELVGIGTLLSMGAGPGAGPEAGPAGFAACSGFDPSVKNDASPNPDINLSICHNKINACFIK